MEKLKPLKGKRIAILATDGFEETELQNTMETFIRYGALVQIISDKPLIRSWKNRSWGGEYKTNRMLDDTNLNDFDALLLPGGVLSNDRLRRNQRVIEMIREFSQTKKIIAAICHGVQLVIEAELVEGKKVTGHFAVRKDIHNAGGLYEDSGAVADLNLITGRSSDDVSAFVHKVVELLEVPELIGK